MFDINIKMIHISIVTLLPYAIGNAHWLGFPITAMHCLPCLCRVERPTLLDPLNHTCFRLLLTPIIQYYYSGGKTHEAEDLAEQNRTIEDTVRTQQCSSPLQLC